MTEILDYANRLAVRMNLPYAVKPITKWRRAHTFETVAGLTITKIGKLTSPESAVFQSLRANVALVTQAQRKCIALIYLDISTILGLDAKTSADVAAVISDLDRFKTICEEKGITAERSAEWTNGFQKALSEFDVEKAIDIMKVHLVTFFLAMRHDPEWDYDNTSELSVEEFYEIYDFIVAEEDAITPESNGNEPEPSLKK